MHLSRREKFMIIALVLIAILVGGVQLLILPAKKQMESYTTQLDEKITLLMEMETKADTLPKVQEDLSTAKTNSISVASRFVEVQIAEKLDAQLHSWLDASGLMTTSLLSSKLTTLPLQGYSPLPNVVDYPAKDALGLSTVRDAIEVPVSDAFPCVQYTFAFEGGYAGILQFLDIVDQQDYGFHVDALNFEWAQDSAQPLIITDLNTLPTNTSTFCRGNMTVSIYMVDQPNFS